MLEGWQKDKNNVYSADELLQKYIDVYNRAVSKIPSDMHVGIHLCRGNFVNSRHFSEGKHSPLGALRQ
jgi:methionine synthase II (cobalamin-independent)